MNWSRWIVAIALLSAGAAQAQAPKPIYQGATVTTTFPLVVGGALKGISDYTNGTGSGSNLLDTDITDPSIPRYDWNRKSCGTPSSREAIVGGLGGFVDCEMITHYYGGSAVTSGRNSFEVLSFLSAPTNSGNTNRNYVAIQGQQFVQSGDGGGQNTTTTGTVSAGATVIPVTSATGYVQYNNLAFTCVDTTAGVAVVQSVATNNVTTASGVCTGHGGLASGATVTNYSLNAQGAGFAFGGGVRPEAGANGLLEVTSAEMDYTLPLGTSAKYKAGFSIVGNNNDAVQGGVWDCELCLSNQASTVGQRAGILFGPMNGFFPLDANVGVAMQTIGGTLASALDFSSSTFNASYMKFPRFFLTQTGALEFAATAGAGFDSSIVPTGGSGTLGDGTLTFNSFVNAFSAASGSAEAIQFYRTDATLSNNTTVASIAGFGQNAGGTGYKPYGKITFNANDTTAGTGQLVMGPLISGSQTDELSLEAGSVNIINSAAIKLAGTVLISQTVPTIASGFCTSPSVSNSNGTAAFEITIGSSCGASTGAVTMPAAAHKWACGATEASAPGSYEIAAVGSSQTNVNFTAYSRTAGTSSNWTAGDTIQVRCAAY